MKPDMDQILKSIREEQVEPAVVEQAADRVWARISAASGVIRGCEDFRAMFPAWRAGELPDARRALLEDHMHECVACRHAAEAGKVLQFPHLQEQAPAARRKTWLSIPQARWAMAAAAFIVLGIGGAGVLRGILSIGTRFWGSKATVQMAQGQLFRLDGAKLVLMLAGEEVPAGEEIRTGRGSGAIVRLGDGSLVEMRERSAFSVTESSTDMNVQLSRGQVIVQAAKRYGKGHLYVTTPDCRVAVTGTVFSVDAGEKGSRVAVVEGEVHVVQNNVDTVLHPGNQTATDPSMEPVPIAEQIAWSQKADQHLALLKEMTKMQGEIRQITVANARYTSNLLPLMPSGTVVYMAIPNFSQALGEAEMIFARHMQESPALQQWFTDKSSGGAQMAKIMDQVRTFGGYMGDEIVIAAAVAQGQDGQMEIQAPVLITELRKSGFQDFATAEFAKMGRNPDGTGGLKVHFMSDAASARESGDLIIAIQNNMLAISPSSVGLRTFASSMTAQRGSRGTSTPFLSRIQQSYQEGAGFLFAADVQTMTSLARNADGQPGIPQLGNLQFLIADQRDVPSSTGVGTQAETRAEMTFSGARQGIMGWLARPAPIGALEYVTSQASAVSAFAITNPGRVIDDMLTWTASGNANFPQDLTAMESDLGFSFRNDLGTALGSELVLAVDGPILPTPSWKVVAEAYDPGKLQWIFTKMAEASNRKISKTGGSPLQMTQSTSGNQTYYRIVYPDAQPLAEIDYTFSGGYLIAAPNRTLLDSAIQAHVNGDSLPRSKAFRDALPHDREANFSALAYQNLAQSLSSVLGHFGNAATNGRQRKAIEATAVPTLIGAYGEDDRISITGVKGLELDMNTLINLTGPFGLFQIIENEQAKQGTKQH